MPAVPPVPGGQTQDVQSAPGGRSPVLQPEPTLFHQTQAQLVVLLRLAAISGKDVRSDGTIGYDSAYGLHSLQIPFTGVPAVHQL